MNRILGASGPNGSPPRIALALAILAWSSSAAFGQLPGPSQIAQNETTALQAGSLTLRLDRVQGGVRVAALTDTLRGRELLTPAGCPIFEMSLQDVLTKSSLPLSASSGWADASAVEGPRPNEILISWRNNLDRRLQDFAVTVRIVADPSGAFHWTLQSDHLPKDWTVLSTRFPQVEIADFGDNAQLFQPRGDGRVLPNVFRRPIHCEDQYPSGMLTMQFLAVYDSAATVGLYLGVHDPLASAKTFVVHSSPNAKTLRLIVEQPAANMGVGGNGFKQSGEVVWRGLHGDWFDASMIYRDWARSSARWYPKLGADGRADSPKWMRELCAWALIFGSAEETVRRAEDFQKMLGVPVGIHWYEWHNNPLDNDYPHYFPAKPKFAGAVHDAQAHNMFAMPYINGRLWDTRDRGLEDFEFSRIALPSAAKDSSGKPIIETLNTKESDGSAVRCAVMCPTTELWKRTMVDTATRLFREESVRAVYLDQVAAAAPALCMDPTHGHPLGGGHWWPEAYWSMLDEIRARRPAETALTTESNAEPYVGSFDGFLTWSWQEDGQVPAFAAVYGGAIQLFGRAYDIRPGNELALRMKAGQQLTYGEQIGWIDPSVVNEKENAAFLRQIVRLRYALRRYFFAGAMARPPRSTKAVPRVTAEWHFNGPAPVTTDAVLSGAWQLPADGTLVLLLVNVTEQAIPFDLSFNADAYELSGRTLTIASVTENGADPAQPCPRSFVKPLRLPAKSASAFEITAR